MAEELCHSAPVVQDGQNFDGTMRVGFSLHRIEEPSENAKDSEEEDAGFLGWHHCWAIAGSLCCLPRISQPLG